jgi:uncharacterized membrane protein YeaQ/YmgE (transglycosylase-associated protein family)
MDILILIFFGSFVGWLVSKPSYTSYSRSWDIAMGAIGALACSAAISAIGIPGSAGYTTYTFVVAMMGAVAIIYIGRSLGRSV